MLSPAVRFAREFTRPAQHPRFEREVLFDAWDGSRPATLYLPPGATGPSAWVLLHGVTVPGRHHDSLRRMARSVAASGSIAFVPEVPSWTELRVDAAEAARTAEAALAALLERPGLDPRRIGLMAFSVAATWGLIAAAGPLRGRFRAIVSVGAYAELRTLLLGMFAGERHGPKGIEHYAPDPYGRWIMGANLLPLLPDDRWGTGSERRTATEALRELAHTAGRNGASSMLPVFDDLKVQLRRRLSGNALAAWDALAPPARRAVAPGDAPRRLAEDLAQAAVDAIPDIEPAGRLDGLDVPVIFLHGKSDALVPYPETLRLAAMLPYGTPRDVTITRLVGHTKAREARRPKSPVALATEARALWRCFGQIATALE